MIRGRGGREKGGGRPGGSPPPCRNEKYSKSPRGMFPQEPGGGGGVHQKNKEWMSTIIQQRGSLTATCQQF